MPFVGRTNGKRERDMRSDGAFPFLSAILGLRRVSSPYHNKSCSEAIVVLGIRPWPGVNGAVVKGANDIEERRVVQIFLSGVGGGGGGWEFRNQNARNGRTEEGAFVICEAETPR